MTDHHPLIDISRRISEQATIYPGDEPLRLRPLCEIGPGCPCNITELGWSTHFLTHVDPPRHFFADGLTLEDIPLERFTGIATVVQVTGEAVQAEDLNQALVAKGATVFFKTRNSARSTENTDFDENHVYISEQAAQRAAQLELNMIGIDYLSVDRFGDERYPAHRALLGGGVLVLEGLDLSAVKAGRYRFYAFPLRLERGDGSPVRALLEPLDAT